MFSESRKALYRRLQLREPGTPVILVTAAASEINLEEARAQGVDGLVQKPFEFEEVIQAVTQALVQRERG